MSSLHLPVLTAKALQNPPLCRQRAGKRGSPDPESLGESLISFSFLSLAALGPAPVAGCSSVAVVGSGRDRGPKV